MVHMEAMRVPGTIEAPQRRYEEVEFPFLAVGFYGDRANRNGGATSYW